MMKDRNGVLIARSASVATCEHGTVFLRLHGADGKVFAAAIMDQATAAAFTAEMSGLVEGSATMDCAGHA